MVNKSGVTVARVDTAYWHNALWRARVWNHLRYKLLGLRSVERDEHAFSMCQVVKGSFRGVHSRAQEDKEKL